MEGEGRGGEGEIFGKMERGVARVGVEEKEEGEGKGEEQ